MSKGDFKNLSGYGKPLQDSHLQNPYVDFAQQKINKILLDNGFSPEWITLQKEIRLQFQQLKSSLKRNRWIVVGNTLELVNETEWNYILLKNEPNVNAINKKIDKYNILVPLLNKQMMRINLKQIAQQIMLEPIPEDISNIQMNQKNSNNKRKTESDAKGLFSYILSLF